MAGWMQWRRAAGLLAKIAWVTRTSCKPCISTHLANATERTETANCPPLTNSNARIRYSYDDLGRVTGVNYPGATPDITYQYDANGNVTRTSNDTSTWDYAYTTADQIRRETLTIDGLSYRLIQVLLQIAQ